MAAHPARVAHRDTKGLQWAPSAAAVVEQDFLEAAVAMSTEPVAAAATQAVAPVAVKPTLVRGQHRPVATERRLRAVHNLRAVCLPARNNLAKAQGQCSRTETDQIYPRPPVAVTIPVSYTHLWCGIRHRFNVYCALSSVERNPETVRAAPGMTFSSWSPSTLLRHNDADKTGAQIYPRGRCV